MLITNGGTLSIESPFDYSKEARGLLSELGIDPVTLEAKSEKITDRTGLSGLAERIFLRQRNLWHGPSGGGIAGRQTRRGMPAPGPTWKEFLAKTPLSEQAQADIARLQEEHVDYMPGLSDDEKKDRLSRISYKDFLLNVVKVHPDVIPFYQTRTHGLYGVGIDAVGALELWPNSPGFQGMNLKPGPYRRLSFTALGEHIPKEALRVSLPGWQRDHRAASGAISDSRPPCRATRPRIACWRMSITAVWTEAIHRSASAWAAPACARVTWEIRRKRKRSKSSMAAKSSFTPCAPSRAFWAAGT